LNAVIDEVGRRRKAYNAHIENFDKPSCASKGAIAVDA
jgi:hypothetical protein